MNRLTEKRDGLYYDIEECVVSNCSQKLGQLEDIEEELGIDLTILFSALKNGIWCYYDHEQLIHDYVWLINNYVGVGVNAKLSFAFKTFNDNQILLFENYGKTWALTKGELENDK